ncbi:MAG: hypothetical protein AB1801_04085 [Chloroflexota bacterium]
MNQQHPHRVSARHTLAVMIALTGAGLLVWITQLARQGDPVGYIILTGLGVLASLPVAGGVLYLLIVAIGKVLQTRSAPAELKTVYDTHRVLEAQNRELARMLNQLQRNPTLLASLQSPEQATVVELGPGQVRTPEGFVIDGTAFDALEDE